MRAHQPVRKSDLSISHICRIDQPVFLKDD
jgi:hypothetical protein